MAAKYFTRHDSWVIGMVKAGIQARTQLLGLFEIFKIDQTTITDRSLDSARIFIIDCKTSLD